MNRSLTLCLIIALCLAAGCSKHPAGPDLSLYTPKLAGEKVWKRQWKRHLMGTNDTTVYLPDTSFAIAVKANDHLSVYGYELFFDAHTDDVLEYHNRTDNYTSLFGGLHYYYKKDSIVFLSRFYNKGNYGIEEFTTHL